MEKPKVYFSKNISKENVLNLYKALNVELKGNVAIKVHSGEKGNPNYLRPEFMEKIVKHLDGTIVECNTAYEGARNTTEKHLNLLEENGWNIYKTDIMDSAGPDLELDIPAGIRIDKNYVGKNITNYDSMLVISHFKGHPMGGFGGALKQLSIGCASTKGKCYIHSGNILEQDLLWSYHLEQDPFIESMADAASSVVELFKDNIAYINIMCNMSVDCDCCKKAETPCMEDLGILASLDPVAIDKACIDLVKSSTDPGKNHFLERVTSRNGEYILDIAENLGVGSKDYELINLD